MAKKPKNPVKNPKVKFDGKDPQAKAPKAPQRTMRQSAGLRASVNRGGRSRMKG